MNYTKSLFKLIALIIALLIGDIHLFCQESNKEDVEFIVFELKKNQFIEICEMIEEKERREALDYNEFKLMLKKISYKYPHGNIYMVFPKKVYSCIKSPAIQSYNELIKYDFYNRMFLVRTGLGEYWYVIKTKEYPRKDREIRSCVRDQYGRIWFKLGEKSEN